MKLIEKRTPSYVGIEQECHYCKTKFIIEETDIEDIICEEFVCGFPVCQYKIICPICKLKIYIKTKE